MNIHETIIFIHICKPKQKHMHRYMYKYISTDILTRLPIFLSSVSLLLDMSRFLFRFGLKLVLTKSKAYVADLDIR